MILTEQETQQLQVLAKDEQKHPEACKSLQNLTKACKKIIYFCGYVNTWGLL